MNQAALRTECARLQLQLAQAPGGLSDEVAWVRVGVRTKGVYNTWRTLNRLGALGDADDDAADADANDVDADAGDDDVDDPSRRRNRDDEAATAPAAAPVGLVAAVADAVTLQVIFELKQPLGATAPQASSSSSGSAYSAYSGYGSRGFSSSSGSSARASGSTVPRTLPRVEAAVAEEFFSTAAPGELKDAYAQRRCAHGLVCVRVL